MLNWCAYGRSNLLNEDVMIKLLACKEAVTNVNCQRVLVRMV